MSGYHLYRSSHLLSFPDKYPEIFLSDHPLAEPVYIIVQNAGLGEWLSRFLTQKQGGVMGLNILMPEQALRKFVLGFPSACSRVGGNAEKLLFLDGMKLTFYKALEELLDTDKAFTPIQDYLGSNKTGRLWQLAEVLAPIFHHYGMNSRPLIDAWNAGLPCPGLNEIDRRGETWQRHVWQRVFQPQSPYAHLSQVLSVISESSEEYHGEQARIVLFGSTFLGERGLEFFRKLADFMDVHHFILSPYSSMKHPSQLFLSNNARLSIGFNSLIPGLHPDQLLESWINPGPEGTTLHTLRSSLMNDEIYTAPPIDDGSLNFHDTAGMRRSVEILKDQILIALADDSSLAPTHIGVLAPEISLFTPYIEMIFPSLDNDGFPRPDHVPYNIMDLPARKESPFPSALSALLNLPGSRFGRGELLRLMENPCFAPISTDPSLAEQWKVLIDYLNIRWGVDEKHRQASGAADPRTGSWKQGFQRILAGYYHDMNDDPDILPVPDVADTFAEDAGRLMHIVMALDEDIRPLDKKVMSLREWTSLWEHLVAKWLIPRREEFAASEDENDRIRIKKIFRDINALSDNVNALSDFNDSDIPWLVFKSLLDEFRSNSVGRRGRYLAHGVTCGSLKPTRAIPFRRIYVIGLDEETWPGRDILTSFDLRDKVPRAIDISRESVNRFALLEVLFSASDHLSLFYTGRDAEHGQALTPSVPVQELMNHLGEGVETLLRHHPLVPYDPAALTGTGPLATTSAVAISLAKERGKHPLPIESMPLPPPEEGEAVDWNSLVRFLKNPVEHFYRRRLGASLIIEGMVPEDFDILESESLRWWRQREEAIRGDISSFENPEEFVRAYRHLNRLESAVSHTPLADIQLEKWEEETKAICNQLMRITRDGFYPESSFSCRLAEISHSALSSTTPESDFFDLPAPTASPNGVLPLTVTGIIDGLGFLHSGGQTNRNIWTLVDFISRLTPQSSHNLRGWVAAVVIASALGENAPREIRIFRIGGRDYKARRYFFREEDVPDGKAGEKVLMPNPSKLLDSLVRVYRKGEQSPLPLYPELVDKISKSLDTSENIQTKITEAWNTIVTDTYSPFSAMRDCPWRQRFLSNPSLNGSHLRQALMELYIHGGIL